MGTARRLYVYFVSLVSLIVVAVGFGILATMVLDRVAESLGSGIIGDSGGVVREQTSLAIALLVVGLPVWLIHTWLAERAVNGSAPGAEEERRSAIRALHLAVVQGAALALGVPVAIDLLSRLLSLVVGADRDSTWTGGAALLVTVVPIWLYHGARRDRDIRRTPMRGAAAWLTRLYRYGAAFAGLIVGLIAATALIGTVLQVLVGVDTFGAEEGWWRGTVAGSIAGMIVGFCVWWIHWIDGQRAVRDGALIGEDERTTRLRAAYVGAVLLVALANGAFVAASSLAEIGRWLLGSADWSGTIGFLEKVVGPPIAVLPFVVAGWLLRRARRAEVNGVGRDAVASDVRLTGYLVSVVGLAFIAIGTIGIVALLVEQIAGTGPVIGARDDFERGQVPWFIGQVVAGGVLWWPAWRGILRRRAADPLVERGAPASRAYLYLVAGLSFAAAVPSAVFVLFRAIDVALGGSAGLGTPSEVALPFAILAFGAVCAAYHGRIAVLDHRSGATTADEPVPPVVAPALTSVGLFLRGPAGSDLEAVVSSLRHHLPPGVTLETETPSGG